MFPKRHVLRKQAYPTTRLLQLSIYSAQSTHTTVPGCPRKLIFQPFPTQVTPRELHLFTDTKALNHMAGNRGALTIFLSEQTGRNANE